ncbi:OmpA family protein [Acuticoccus sp. M5D2P5]|uniref:OmpA family protein n=1 Tax=Acuticoccus kalidii TaxID=2910977 RepID=UPI001F388D46|nr:OmpA family protein [Acuticoccus kalidii]MCF3934270.1 OmpA family protein [Acuticoccus kalidii]
MNAHPNRFRWRADRYDVYGFNNGWTETVVVRPNGVRVVTISDSYGLPIRRYRETPGVGIVTLFNNMPQWWGGNQDVIVDVRPVTVNIPRNEYIVEPSRAPVEQVYQAVTAEPVAQLDRSYTLNQVLFNENLRDYMPRVDIDTITFAMDSAEVPYEQIDTLEVIGAAIEEAVADNPQEVFLIEGHTDAVGADLYNLELSDRRAESVATILTEYFEIPPENLVSQGFGEQYLKEQTDGPSQVNRRVAIRRITPLLSTDDEIAGLDQDDLANIE